MAKERMSERLERLKIDPPKSVRSKRNLLEAYALTTSRRKRARIFFSLWWLNAKKRNLTLANLVFVLPQMPSSFLHYLRDGQPSGERRPVLPARLHMLESEIAKDYVEVVRVIMSRKYSGRTLAKHMLETSKDALAAMVVVQTMLSLLQTIFEVSKRDGDGRMQRRTLLAMAERCGLSSADTSKKNMDELRVMVAQCGLARRLR